MIVDTFSFTARPDVCSRVCLNLIHAWMHVASRKPERRGGTGGGEVGGNPRPHGDSSHSECRTVPGGYRAGRGAMRGAQAWSEPKCANCRLAAHKRAFGYMWTAGVGELPPRTWTVL